MHLITTTLKKLSKLNKTNKIKLTYRCLPLCVYFLVEEACSDYRECPNIYLYYDLS